MGRYIIRLHCDTVVPLNRGKAKIAKQEFRQRPLRGCVGVLAFFLCFCLTVVLTIKKEELMTRKVLISILLTISLSAFANAQSITTTFANNNGGAPGWTNYFDVNVTNPLGLILESFELNTDTVGTPFSIDVYTTAIGGTFIGNEGNGSCLLYTSPSPRDLSTSRMPSSA